MLSPTAVLKPYVWTERSPYWTSDRRRPRRPPKKAPSPVDLDREDQLVSEIELAVRRDAEHGLRRAAVLSYQARLKRLVDDRAWLVYLELEKAQIARWHRVLLLVARRSANRRSR